MTDVKFIDLVKRAVADYFNTRKEITDSGVMSPDDVYIVWYCKALQNWKALASTVVTDGMYYEITLNGDQQELYLDAYKKWENKKLSL